MAGQLRGQQARDIMEAERRQHPPHLLQSPQEKGGWGVAERLGSVLSAEDRGLARRV